MPLQCTHVVEGHSNSVLSVQISGSSLYTGSAGNLMQFSLKKNFNYYPFYTLVLDRTVRIWDLGKGSAGPQALISHPGPVVSVVLDRKSGLLYSACGSFVRAWDGRSGFNKPCKILR